jgi:hypothetical protein
MRARMNRFVVLSALVLAAACGKEIGDECSVSLDCGDGTDERICDKESPGGYCTLLGCDWNNCPEEAVCVRFYAASFANKPCVLATEDLSTDDCTLDEVCTLKGQCVPRSSEVRYCMRTCDSGGDCRDRYECRDEALMVSHGGEPVPKPGERLGGDLQSFCAPAPATP